MELDLSQLEPLWALHGLQLKRTLTGFGSQGVYHIQATEGEFIFKWHDPSLDVARLHAELTLVDALPARGFHHTPRLRKAVNGELWGRLTGGVGYLYHFVPGDTPAPTPEHYAQLGQLTVTLHQVSGSFHPLAWTIQDIVGHIIQDRAPLTPAIFRTEYVALAQRLPALDHLPKALIHGDLALVNVIKSPDGMFTVVDWEGCGWGVRLFDLAYLFFQWLSDDLSFAYTSAQAFFHAYLARQPLTAEEWRALPDLSLLLPLNFILFGDTALKWQKILWLHQHRAEILRSVMA